MLLAAWLCAGTSMAWAVSPAAAQTATDSAVASQEPGPTATTAAGAQDIIVTGSRITASGFTAPTPTTILSAEQLQASAQPNLFDTVSQLPALQGSSGLSSSRQNAGTSFGNNGLSALNLRGLDSIRTLTLLDGQRVVPAYVTGIADVSQFPQLLIKRVDVVTGGASASWGSDAVSGVVNFVTDKHFVGVKGNVQGGMSTYADDKSVLAQMAAGTSLFSDRLHLEFSGEYFHNAGVPAGEVGGAQVNGRPDAYRSGNTSYALGAQPTGTPQYYYYPYDAQTTTLGRTGLITAGPLMGTAFGANGDVYQFQYGTGCVATTCQGGQQDNYITTATVDDPISRVVGYARAGFDILPDVEIYGTLNVAEVKTSNQPIAFPRKPGNLTISCTNPFLPQSVVDDCEAAGISSFRYGTANANLPARELIKSDRRQIRFVVGTDGKFHIGSLPVSFDAYYQHGENKIDVNVHNMTLNSRYNAAIDVVRDGNDQIVCASAVARAEGCLPLNIFGDFPVSDAQFAFLAPANGPYQKTTLKEDVASLSFNTSPFRDWAGEVSLAFGAEYRREFYVTRGDPYGNGVTAETPNTADYPADPLLSVDGNNWFAGNYHNGTGSFNVREAFLELGIPLMDSQSLGKLDLNLAGRAAHYSTAGNANTWKIGGTWDTPVEGLRLRAVVSRDLRAPNLSELFAAPQTSNQNVTDRATGGNVQIVSETIGNPNLKPEIAKTWEAGIVLRPRLIPGLNMSIDYYNISLTGAIAALSNQQIVDLCYNGNTAFCSNVKLTGALGTADYPYVISQPFNLASLKARGLDFEISYQFDLGSAGKLLLHGMATRAIDLISNTGIDGQQVAQLVGNNTDSGNGVPKWKAYLNQTWSQGISTVTLTERIVSAGKIDPEAIECQTDCPASTVQHPTFSFNHVPGAVYVDLGVSFDITHNAQIYLKSDNLLNHRAPPFGSSMLYDPIGRRFRMGARFNF
jgi:outer membrane receptor protein involved in Fe transport